MRGHIGLTTEYFTRSLIEDFKSVCSYFWLRPYRNPPEYFYYDDSVPDRPDYRLNLQIVGTTAWRWLNTKVIQKIISSSPEPSMMDAIAETVQTNLYLWKTLEGTQLNYSVTFEVAWDPIAFIKDQCYDFGPQEAIARAITLIGTAAEAQAIRSAQYIDEMWPFSGKSVMRLVQGVVSGRPDLPECENLIY